MTQTLTIVETLSDALQRRIRDGKRWLNPDELEVFEHAASSLVTVVESLDVQLLGEPFKAVDAIDRLRPRHELDASLRFRNRRRMKRWTEDWNTLRYKIEQLIWKRVQPTVEDYEVVQVARDLVEEHRIEEAKRMLREHAPRCLGRRCGACGRYPGMPCHEPTGHAGAFVDLVVPHDTRVLPGGA